MRASTNAIRVRFLALDAFSTRTLLRTSALTQNPRLVGARVSPWTVETMEGILGKFCRLQTLQVILHSFLWPAMSVGNTSVATQS